MCDCDLGPHPDFYNEKWLVGRKAYKCCECRATIAPGERHFMACGKWERRFEVFRRCARCQRLAVAIEKAGHCVPFNGLFECHGVYRREFIDDCTDDWVADLEKAYAAGGEGST